MNTVNYDSRNYDFYQFWGDLAENTGFYPPDFAHLTIDEQAQKVTDAITQENELLDFDGEPTDEQTVKRSVKLVLEKWAEEV